jgi:hypothetical protein
MLMQICFNGVGGEGSFVEEAGGQSGVRFAYGKHLVKVFYPSSASRSDDGYGHGFRYGLGH